MSGKYILDSEENREFLKSMTENLIQFGRRFPSSGGASYYLGDDGTPLTGRDRETWITCRMAHVYSIGHMLGYAHCGELAGCALKGLNGILHDKKNGGWYVGVAPDGSIVPGKQCYAHAFVILAATSALLAEREGAKELLEEGVDFTALYVVSDNTAFGACKAILECGKRIPEDYSVAGFDGIKLARYYHPSLTTMRQPCEEMAKESIRLLIDLIEGRKENQHKIFQAELLEGESVREIVSDF